MSIKKIDNYRIRLNEILGVNGNTFIGYNNISKQQVVIKVLDKSEVAKKYANNIQAFKQKVKFLHKIRKSASYVVRYLNLLETNNNFYLIQQFCKGGNLKKILSQKRLNTTEAFKYMRHLLKGFMQLIKKGIYHGNLTPSNILFHNGLMKLADFGVQLNKVPQSNEGQIKNTVYIAPEILLGGKYSQKSDIWSLGFIFYEMIFGYVPWKTGGSSKTYIQRLKNEPLQFPSQPQISSEIKNLIRGCLHIDPNKRLEWTDIYLDDIFNGQFLQIQSVDIRLGYILRKVGKAIFFSNLNLEKYFKDQMITIESVLNYEKFAKIFYFIDSDMVADDIKYVFNVLDSNNTKMIDLASLINLFQHYEVCLDYQLEEKKLKKKVQTYETKHSLSKDEDLSEKLLQKLFKTMKQRRIFDIQHLLSQQERDLSRQISSLQFSNLLKKIDPKIPQGECRIIFKKIDTNNDGKISYQQFLQIISMFKGSPYKFQREDVASRKSF